MKTIRVWKEDFKDFRGLQERAHYLKSYMEEEHDTFFVFKIHDDEWNNPYNNRNNDDTYNKVLDIMSREFTLEEAHYIRKQMDELKQSADSIMTAILSKLCYPKTHINRRINIR